MAHSPITEQMQQILDGLRENGPGWHDVSRAYTRQWRALAARGLIEFRSPGRGAEARVVGQADNAHAPH
jgi:hypothetical protein